MKTKVGLILLMALIVVCLTLINHPQSAPPQTPAPTPARSALSVLPAHFNKHSSASIDEADDTNMFHRLLKGKELPKLTAEQIEPYLRANHRSAESLLAGLRTTGDRAYLHEAMEKFPHDPKVAYAALYFGNLSPEETRQWADNFKQSAPGNAMADYASAFNYLKSGQPDLALQDVASGAKGSWTDYSLQFMQNSEEAYRAAGYSDIDAKIAAQAPFQLPDLSQLKQLGVQLNDLAKTYQQNGDTASAQSLLQMDVQLGKQLNATDTQPLITTLVGIAVEKIALSSMDPNAPYGNTGQTVQDQINQITQQREYIRNVTAQFEGVRSSMSDQDILNFYERRRSFGEPSAMQWAVNKYGSPP